MPAVIGLLKSAAKFSKLRKQNLVVQVKSASKSERNSFGRAMSTVQSFAGDIGWDPGCQGPVATFKTPPLHLGVEGRGLPTIW